MLLKLLGSNFAEVIHVGSIDSTTFFLQVMFCRQVVANPLPESMTFQFTDLVWKMIGNENWHNFWQGMYYEKIG